LCIELIDVWRNLTKINFYQLFGKKIIFILTYTLIIQKKTLQILKLVGINILLILLHLPYLISLYFILRGNILLLYDII
jgi:hypothetical protein